MRLRLRLRGGFVEISWAVMKLVRLIGNNQAEVKAEDERQSNLSLFCWKNGITKVSLSYLRKGYPLV